MHCCHAKLLLDARNVGRVVVKEEHLIVLDAGAPLDLSHVRVLTAVAYDHQIGNDVAHGKRVVDAQHINPLTRPRRPMSARNESDIHARVGASCKHSTCTVV